MLEYSQDFFFYMTTNMSRPHYSPEICIKVTLINFQITPQGLEDQLLNLIVQIKNPEIEKERQIIMAEYYENKQQLKKNEDKIIQFLI